MVPIIVILVGVGAFGLGRLSALEEGRGVLKIYAPEAEKGTQAAAVAANQSRVLATPTSAPAEQLSVMATSSAPEVAKNFVASKNGTKYYPAGCSGASRIKSANQVWFATAADAQAAGYSVAGGCK